MMGILLPVLVGAMGLGFEISNWYMQTRAMRNAADSAAIAAAANAGSNYDVEAKAVAAQYGYLISEGPSQLAVYQEGYRNGVNARPVRQRARVASFLKANPPARLILMNSGALGPIVPDGGLRFSEIIHEGTVQWHQLGEGIPKGVATVIVQQGDPLDLLISENPVLERELAAEFARQLSVGNITVYSRSGKTED